MRVTNSMKALLALAISAAAPTIVAGQCADGSVGTSLTYTGYMIDNLCWDAPNHRSPDGSKMDVNPEDHTKKCLLMPPCIASGYSILEMLDDGTYAPKYVLDEASTAMAVEMVEASDKEDDFVVTVEGVDCGDTVSVSRILLEEEVEEEEEEEGEGTEGDAACESFTHTGYIVDNACWFAPDHIAADGAKMDVNPEDHTKMCLLMPPCIASGYNLLEMQADGKYAPKYYLDDESNAMAVQFFEESTNEKDYKVVVEGSNCGGSVTITTMALASDAPPEETPPDVEAPPDDETSSAFRIVTSTVGSSVVAFAFALIL